MTVKSQALVVCAALVLGVSGLASGQQPKRDPDRPGEGAELPPSGVPRPGDRNLPPPKAGPRGEGRRGDGPDGFGPGRYGESKGPPGGRGPGGWGAPPPDDPEMRELVQQD